MTQPTTDQTSETYHIPDDRYYDQEHHLWAKLDSTSGRITIGIDSLGLAALGDLAYNSFQAVGMPIKRGESIGVLEAAKMTGDLIAPVSGVLVDRNEAVLRDPYLVNTAPYGEGWLVAIEAGDWENESTRLVSGEALPAWIAAEIERYRAQGWID
jgi:glycine cleavage system H protein